METTASTSAQPALTAQQPRPRAAVCQCYRPAPLTCQCHEPETTTHSSPRSAVLPSPPDSPLLDPYWDADIDSLSSFPSISSSVFFSSGAGSPHSHPHSRPLSDQLCHHHLHEHEHIIEHEHDHEFGHGHDAGLVIPSLTLPSALPQPTPYGQGLGDAAFILIGPTNAGAGALAEFLADADDVVDAAAWEPVPGGVGARVLRASTDWIEERDQHGLERFEGTANVSFLELDGFDAAAKPEYVIENVLRHVHDVFHDVRNQLDNSPSSPLLHSLLASSHSTLFTALIYVTATPLTAQDHAIITGLASSIPIIPFSTTSSSAALSFARHASIQPKLSFFQPRSYYALRLGLFRSPNTLASLRAEAADRFMRWREVERAVADMSSSVMNPGTVSAAAMRRRDTITGAEDNNWAWSKAAWEVSLSEDIARRMRLVNPPAEKSEFSTEPESRFADPGSNLLATVPPYFAPVLDPLHFRSLMMLSLALLVPPSISGTTKVGTKSVLTPGMVGVRSASTVKPASSSTSSSQGGWGAWRWGLAIMGVFCAGMGIGLVLSS
ncbi:hypothetical protein EW145_g4427 [Phellinidium pouzarii]|uniref:Uncharacterized protein n=1 Tax=Phellinidium pouzarii TaxID=167371 RepID=A0A4S4L4Y4_9AGAM|nr:hypothetical protein EW145_g4427 [Phellinidium pouzarii]